MYFWVARHVLSFISVLRVLSDRIDQLHGSFCIILAIIVWFLFIFGLCWGNMLSGNLRNLLILFSLYRNGGRENLSAFWGIVFYRKTGWILLVLFMFYFLINFWNILLFRICLLCIDFYHLRWALFVCVNSFLDLVMLKSVFCLILHWFQVIIDWLEIVYG